MIEWLNTILQGVLLGGLYAIFAGGLALIFAIDRPLDMYRTAVNVFSDSCR